MSENINEILETKDDPNQSTSGGTLTNTSSESGFFSFKKMISLPLIKILYVIGIFVITIGSIVMIVDDEDKLLFGIAVIVIGNLLWRILCEGWIIIFNLHDTTVSILNELKRK